MSTHRERGRGTESRGRGERDRETKRERDRDTETQRHTETEKQSKKERSWLPPCVSGVLLGSLDSGRLPPLCVCEASTSERERGRMGERWRKGERE